MSNRTLAALQERRLDTRIEYARQIIQTAGCTAILKMATLPSLLRARTKLALGSYGRCDGCGHEIPSERLDVVPGAIYCVPCQMMIEDG